MSSPLAQRLAQAKWGNFPVKDLFEIESTKRKFDANKVVVLEQGTAPYVIRSSINNGQKGYLNENENILIPVILFLLDKTPLLCFTKSCLTLLETKLKS